MSESTDRPDHEPTRPLPDEETEPTTRLEDEAPDEMPATQPTYAGATGQPEDDRPSGRHPMQVGYFVAGLMALGLSLLWLLSETGVVDQPANDSVGISLVLIAAGLAGLLASVGRMARRRS